MANARVVDTNVLYVASAADPASPFPAAGTPVEKAMIRDEVLNWLQEFERDPERHVVIDWDWYICREYLKKKNRGGITEQDYGWLAIMTKRDRNEVAWVGLTVDGHGHAVLPADVSRTVTDLDDRKMVAAVMAALADGHNCKLTVACDTDWLDCEACLNGEGIAVEYLVEQWLRDKWAAKKAPA
ncbi:MAG TPA: hypothetical protein DHV85_10210 [Candidatus Accumulibacter sp.]|nr:hypothetical protein [Accumulibacter sp.]